MELWTYIQRLVMWEFIKRFDFIGLFTHDMLGYSIREEGIKIEFRERKPSILITDLKYDIAYFRKCHKVGYHINHWKSKIPTKRTIYTIIAHSGDCNENSMTIRTTNERVYPNLKNQYDALYYINPPVIEYLDRKVDMSGNPSGIGLSKKSVIFKNIIKYSQFKDEVTTKKKLNKTLQ